MVWGDNSQLWCQKHLSGISECARKAQGGWGIRLTHSTAAPGYFPFLTRININKGGQELLQRIKRQKQSISHGIKPEHLFFFPSYSWNLVSTARGNIALMEKEINPKYLSGNHFKAEKAFCHLLKEQKTNPIQHSVSGFSISIFSSYLVNSASCQGRPENKAGTGRSPGHPWASSPLPTEPLWRDRATLTLPSLSQETEFPFDVSPVHVLLLF